MPNWVEKVSTDEQIDDELSCLERMLISAEMDVFDLLKKVHCVGKIKTLDMENEARALFDKLQKAIEES